MAEVERRRISGRRVAPLALLPNSYAALKEFADECRSSMEDGLKDELISAKSTHTLITTT